MIGLMSGLSASCQLARVFSRSASDHRAVPDAGGAVIWEYPPTDPSWIGVATI